MNAENKATTQAPKTRRTVILAMLIAAVATLGICTLYTNHQYEVDMEYLSTVKIEDQDSLLETIPNPEVSLPDRVNYPVYLDAFDADYREEIEWLHQQGLNGLVEPNSPYFYPENKITEAEWRNMLATAFPNQAELYSTYDHKTALYTNDWWRELEGGDQVVTQAKMLETAFKAIGLDVYSDIIHENDVIVNVWGEMTREEQYSYLGWRLGLVRAGIPEQEMYRYEAAHILYNLINNREDIEAQVEEMGTPEILTQMKISYSEVTDDMNRFVEALDKVPQVIKDRFIEDGWVLRINDPYQYEYNEKNDKISIGVTMLNHNTILVISPVSVPHEFAHYLDKLTGVSSTSEFEEIYSQEVEQAATLMDRASIYNSEEYFATAFTHYVELKALGKLGFMQEAVPLTYQFFQTLEANNWEL